MDPSSISRWIRCTLSRRGRRAWRATIRPVSRSTSIGARFPCRASMETLLCDRRACTVRVYSRVRKIGWPRPRADRVVGAVGMDWRTWRLPCSDQVQGQVRAERRLGIGMATSASHSSPLHRPSALRSCVTGTT